MSQCEFTDCDQKAVHKIKDAVLNPKVWNGKMICKEHQDWRVLLAMDEPPHEEVKTPAPKKKKKKKEKKK